MKRRQLILGLSAASVGSAGVVGSGAVSQITADRNVQLRITGDHNGYLEFDPLSELASIGTDGITEFNLTQFNEIPDVEGEGFNSRSVYEITGTTRDNFQGVFGLRNQSDRPIEFASTTVGNIDNVEKPSEPGELDFDALDKSDPRIELFRIEDDERTAIDANNWFELGIGVQKFLGLRLIVPEEVELGSHEIQQVIVAREA